MTIPRQVPVLKPENVFYIATRAFEPAEIEFITQNNISVSFARDITNEFDIERIISDIKQKIGNRPYVVSFDFDAIDPKYFSDVLVPESGGITFEMAKTLIRSFHDAYCFEFVEYSPNGDKMCEQIVHDLIKIAME